MKSTKRAYYAGVVDGRAFLGMNRDSPMVSVKVRGNLPKKLYDKFGGSYVEIKKTGWWRVYGESAASFLEQVLPYLRRHRKMARRLVGVWRKRHRK